MDKPGYWSGVTRALSFFDDTSMIRVLEKTKKVLEERNRKLGFQWSDATFIDLGNDNELQTNVNLLFGRFY